MQGILFAAWCLVRSQNNGAVHRCQGWIMYILYCTTQVCKTAHEPQHSPLNCLIHNIIVSLECLRTHRITLQVTYTATLYRVKIFTLHNDISLIFLV